MAHRIIRGLHLRFLSLLIFAFCLLNTAAVSAQCPSGTLFVDLEHGTTMPAALPERMTLLSLAPSVNPYCSGWYSAAIRLDLSPPCHEAEIAVEYFKPTAFTLHIADSPTSEAYGGDAGTTLNNAELWINQQILWVASNRTPGGNDNELAQENMALNYGAMKFVVKNQSISWGPPYNVMETPNTKKLFALPDTINPAEGYFIYLGLNRVVGDYPSRSGCGLQRALVTIE
ncbi:MAG TPA: hypothetical protein VF756_00095 [Thermoanaerobaculia bacterium]